MRNCPFCNAELEDDAVFCGECGARLDGETLPETKGPAAAEAVPQMPQDMPAQPVPEPPQRTPAPEAPVYETVFCPNCGVQTDASSAFCQNCGAPLQAEPAGAPAAPADTSGTVFCPNCGMQTDASSAFCQNCGAPLQADAAAVQPAAAAKRRSKLPLLLAAVAVVMVAALVLLLRLGSGSGKPDALYIKDKEIFYRDLSKKEPLEVTTRLFDGGNVDLSDLYGFAACTYNESRTRLFFPDKIDYMSDEVTIYYRDVNKPKKEAERVDTDIRGYAINSAGTKIVYVKGEDGVLYISDLKDKEKIASDVSFFAVTEDAKKVLYLTEDNDLYLWQNGEKEKLASDVRDVYDTADDLSTIYYWRDEDFYCLKTDGGDAEKIASDVYYVAQVYSDTGKLFYVKRDTITYDASDYVIDDMAAADAALTEPRYPSWFDYDTDEAYERAYDAYVQASDEYYDKLSRDYLRDDLKDATFEIDQYTLYYYDGSDSEKISENLANIWNSSCAGDTAAIAFMAYSPEETPSVRLSDLSSVSDISDMVQEAQTASSDCYVYAGGDLMPVEADDAQDLMLSADGRTLYFMEDTNDESVGDLYQADVRGSSVDEPELMDTEVYSWLRFIDGKLCYYKNFNNSGDKGDLYIDGKEINYDVNPYSLSTRDGQILYYTDWSDDKEYGTLMLYKNNKSTKIADDVHTCQFVGDEILYLKDYSINSYRGTLERYNNGKPQKLDEDVSILIQNRDRIGGSYYV